MVRDAIIDGCIRGEAKAQEELYRALYPLMMSICSRYERNRQDAAARMNQGFLKVLRNLHKRGPDVPFEPWVRRIMINTVIDGFRRDRTRRTTETLDPPAEMPENSDVNEYLRHMEAEAFAALLHQVPPMSRNVFNLFAIDGLPHAEIARQLNISEGTSKWHVAHARMILQKAIARLALASTQPIRS